MTFQKYTCRHVLKLTIDEHDGFAGKLHRDGVQLSSDILSSTSLSFYFNLSMYKVAHRLPCPGMMKVLPTYRFLTKPSR